MAKHSPIPDTYIPVGEPMAARRRELSPEQLVVALIAVSFAFRMTLALTVGLGVDESYSLANAADLSLSYFDHPPLHLWIAHAAASVLGDGPLVRLPFVAMFAGTTWLMFRFTERLFGINAGVWAALSLNLSGFFTVAAGEWILPDGPLMFCLSGAAATFAALLQTDRANSGDIWRRWLLVGLWLGAAGLSKYLAVAFATGLALFFVLTPARRYLLKSPAPYVSALLALALVAPVIVWNARNGWVSFAFQAGRASQGDVFKPIHVLTIAGGQILYLLPWVFLPLTWAIVQAIRTSPLNESQRLCLCVGAPLIVLVTLVPMFGPAGLPHWSMAGWLMIFPLLGALLSDQAGHRSWPQRWAQVSTVLLVTISALLASHVDTGWMRNAAPALFAKGDPSDETLSWSPLRAALESRDYYNHASFVVSARWNEAGRIELGLNRARPVLVFAQDPRNFAFRNDPAAFVGQDAIIVGQATTIEENIDLLRPFFDQLIPLPPVDIKRGTRTEIQLHLLYGRRLLQPYPLPYPIRSNATEPGR